jgi:hypothetical protein
MGKREIMVKTYTQPGNNWVMAPTPDPRHDDVSESPIMPGVGAHELLNRVVMAVVSAGHAADLYDFPEVLEYFGAQLPKD